MSEHEKEALEGKNEFPAQPTPYPRIVESETEFSGVETDSTVSSSDTEFPYSTRRRHSHKSHRRRRSRSAGKRRRHRRSYSSSSSRSSSRSRSRSRSYSSSRSRSSSTDSSRSSSPRRKSYGRKNYRPSRLPKTPNFWPKNAVNSKSTPFANTITHPTALISPHAFDSDDMRMGFRRRLQVFLDDPSSSRLAMFFALFIAVLVISSSIGVVVESLKPGGVKKGSDDLAWWLFETATMLVFLAELMIRCLAHSTSWKQFKKFFFSFSNFIDLIAIVPYLIEVVIAKEEKQFKTFTVFRLFRLIRLLHCYGYSTVLQLSLDAMFIAIKKSTDALLAILFFQFFMIVVFSTLIFFFERGTFDEEAGCYLIADAFGKKDCSHFDSIPATFWFVAEVITTVGLGDVYPKTVMGKLLSFPLMLFGLLIIALPSIVLGKNFAEAWLWLKTSGNVQKQALLNAQKQRERLKKKKTKTSTKTGKEQIVQKDQRILSTTQLNESEFKRSPVRASAVFDQQSLKLDNATVLDIGTTDTVPSSQEEMRVSDEVNEELNGETVQSTTNQPYFVSTEALIQSENQDEILQLVQILVEQFQHHTSVVERLSMQQDELLETVSNLKKVQLKLARQQTIKMEASDDSTDRSISRSRSRSRSHSRGRRRSRSHSRSTIRGRSHSRSSNRLSRSRSRSPSPSSRRGRSRSRS